MAQWPGFAVGLPNADDLEGTVKRPASEAVPIQFGPINSGVGPGYPSPHILAKRGEAVLFSPLPLIKPASTLGELFNRLLGQRQPPLVEMIAKKIKAPFDPSNKSLIRCLL